MSWKDTMRPGSFRGVPFFAKSADDGGGRRRAQHVYAGRDEPFSEDTGRKQKEYNLTAFCIGRDYMSQRDALEKALNEAGPGLLVHPWRGEQYVTVDYRVQHSSDEGGMCTFAINCTEAGHNEQPTMVQDTATGLLAGTDAAKLIVIDRFREMFSVKGLPDFVSVDALRELSDLTTTLGDLPGQTAGTTAQGMMSELTPMLGDAGELGSAVYDLVSNAGQVNGLVSADTGGATTATVTGIANMQTLYNYQPTAIPGRYPTVARTQANNNAAAIAALIRQSAGVESTRLIAQGDYHTDFRSRPQADNTVSAVTGQLQELAYDAQDQQYQALNSLRIATMRDYRTRAVQLPDVRKLTPKQTEPALLIAYREHGEALREAEVLQLNAIDHPGFVPGGEVVELVNG